MDRYKHILVASEADNAANDQELVKRAATLAKGLGADISVIQAYQPIGGTGAIYALPSVVELEVSHIHALEQELAAVSDELGVPKSHQSIEAGTVKNLIKKHATKMKADLIVLDNKKSDNFFSKTAASSVLQNAPCDILAVRSRDSLGENA